MINFIAYGKEFRLRNGQIITVKRLSISHYYLLIASVLIYKNALEKTNGIKGKKIVKDYIKFIRENSMDFAKVTVEWTNIKTYLKDWIETDISKLKDEEILECLSCVIDFNTTHTGAGGRALKDLDELNEQFEQIIGMLSIVLKKEPDYITNNISNYQASIIMAEYNRMRVSQMNDLRYAHNADRNEYAKYTGTLLGNKVYTGDEIISNPNILKEVH